MKNDAKKANPKPTAQGSKPVPAERPSLSRAENEGMIAPEPGKLEGEGSYTAARRYDEGVARSVSQGDTHRLAEEAARALEGPEGAKLRAAEKAAKHGHAK